MQNKQLISIVIPIYNEADNLIELAKQLTKVFDNNLSYDFEVMLVENGSADQSFEISQQISTQDNRFKIISISFFRHKVTKAKHITLVYCQNQALKIFKLCANILNILKWKTKRILTFRI